MNGLPAARPDPASADLGARSSLKGWPAWGGAAAFPLLGAAYWGLHYLAAFAHDAVIVFYAGYMVYVLAGVAIHSAFPPVNRPVVLLVLTAIFAVQALPHGLVAAGLAHVLAVFVILRCLPAGPWRLATFVGWMGAFNLLVPSHLLGLQAAEAYTQRYPTAIWLYLLWKLGWRTVFCYYEVAGGVIEAVTLPSLATFLVGLPFLGGNPVAPSYRHFLESTARTPEDIRRSLASGLQTCALGAGAIGLWLMLEALSRAFRLTAPDGRCGALLAGSLLWFLGLYLRRLVTEQGSVGICRLFGYHVRDNYAPTVLLARSPVEFWRGWNILWRDFLMAWIYYPLSIRLGRRFGAQKAWVIAVCGFATFAGAAVFDALFPRALFFVYDDRWRRELIQTLVATLLWGGVVASSLYAHVVRPPRKDERRGSVALKIAGTFMLAWLLSCYKKSPELFHALAVALSRACHALT